MYRCRQAPGLSTWARKSKHMVQSCHLTGDSYSVEALGHSLLNFNRKSINQPQESEKQKPQGVRDKLHLRVSSMSCRRLLRSSMSCRPLSCVSLRCWASCNAAVASCSCSRSCRLWPCESVSAACRMEAAISSLACIVIVGVVYPFKEVGHVKSVKDFLLMLLSR